jgi:nucleoside-diphosphate-sugar epimerase
MSQAVISDDERIFNILITGCNGYIGRLCYNALINIKSIRIILTDRSVGFDADNRFGLEQVDNYSDYYIPESDVHIIDLVNEKDKLNELFKEYKPDIVIHLAGVLENGTLTAIKNNDIINENILYFCNKYNCHCIAASSVMVYYGSCMIHPIISNIFRRHDEVQCPQNEQFDDETELCNNEDTIKLFTKQNWEPTLAYILAKERLEILCRQIASSNESITVIPIRFGWCSIKSVYDIESQSLTADSCTETSVILHPKDLQRFIQQLIRCIIDKRIQGFHIYNCISDHKQRWIALNHEEEELGWMPQELC